MSLKVIDFKKVFTTLDGTEQQENNEPVYLSKILANQLTVQADGFEPERAYELAVNLWADGKVSITADEQKVLYAYVKAHRAFTVIVKAQILELLK